LKRARERDKFLLHRLLSRTGLFPKETGSIQRGATHWTILTRAYTHTHVCVRAQRSMCVCTFPRLFISLSLSIESLFLCQMKKTVETRDKDSYANMYIVYEARLPTDLFPHNMRISPHVYATCALYQRQIARALSATFAHTYSINYTYSHSLSLCIYICIHDKTGLDLSHSLAHTYL